MSERFYVVTVPSTVGRTRCLGPFVSYEVAQAIAAGWTALQGINSGSVYPQVYEVEKP